MKVPHYQAIDVGQVAPLSGGGASGDQCELGWTLLQYRLGLGMTQAEIGKMIGLSQPRISQMENGTYDPSLSVVRRIVDLTGVDFHVLVSK